MPSKKKEQKEKNKIDLANQKYKLPVIAVFVLCILGDIFLTSNGSDIRYYGFLAIGVLAIFLYKVSSRFFLSLALIVLSIMFIFFLTSGPSDKTEKAAVWFFLLFATGIIRQWKE